MSEIKEEQKLSVEQIKERLRDPKINKDLTATASMLLEKVSRNWFGLERITRKTQFKNPSAAKDVLDLLVLAEFAHVKEENLSLRWKITLTKENKLEALKDDIEAIDAQVSLLLDKKEAILSRIRLDEPSYVQGQQTLNTSSIKSNILPQ